MRNISHDVSEEPVGVMESCVYIARSTPWYNVHHQLLKSQPTSSTSKTAKCHTKQTETKAIVLRPPSSTSRRETHIHLLSYISDLEDSPPVVRLMGAWAELTDPRMTANRKFEYFSCAECVNRINDAFGDDAHDTVSHPEEAKVIVKIVLAYMEHRGIKPRVVKDKLAAR